MTLYPDYRPLNLSPFEFFAMFLPVLPISPAYPCSSATFDSYSCSSFLAFALFFSLIHLSSLTLTCPGTSHFSLSLFPMRILCATCYYDFQNSLLKNFLSLVNIDFLTCLLISRSFSLNISSFWNEFFISFLS